MNQPSREDELMAAALAGSLSAAERRELDAACAANPALLRELEALEGLNHRLAESGIEWTEHDVPASLAGTMDTLSRELSAPGPTAKAVTAENAGTPEVQHGVQAGGTGQREASRAHVLRARDGGPPTSGGRRYRVPLLAAAAAALLVIGGLGGSALATFQQAPPTGPPGTLGAIEGVQLSGSPAGTSFDASLVAHTWGTETVLAIDGLPVGESFEVVLVRTDGRELDSGTFLGAAQTVTCRMNAAVLRGDVAALQIRNAAGTVVASSNLPRV
ncbi:hypothetical protein ACRB8A_17350 [Arthrobacter sp. G.S.26]|uniref:hypothetical protein n=1 Tax=Arthrobacter sp. G.S.26 TaxID=3433706 RepID=UPI003D77AFB5